MHVNEFPMKTSRCYPHICNRIQQLFNRSLWAEIIMLHQTLQLVLTVWPPLCSIENQCELYQPLIMGKWCLFEVPQQMLCWRWRRHTGIKWKIRLCTSMWKRDFLSSRCRSVDIDVFVTLAKCIMCLSNLESELWPLENWGHLEANIKVFQNGNLDMLYSEWKVILSAVR